MKNNLNYYLLKKNIPITNNKNKKTFRLKTLKNIHLPINETELKILIFVRWNKKLHSVYSLSF